MAHDSSWIDSYLHTQEGISRAGSCKTRVHSGYFWYKKRPKNSFTKNCGALC
ncbi:hypothetical protein CsSME_00051438 [Camellia sinensis var. sinensis]